MIINILKKIFLAVLFLLVLFNPLVFLAIGILIHHIMYYFFPNELKIIIIIDFFMIVVSFVLLMMEDWRQTCAIAGFDTNLNKLPNNEQSRQ